MHLAYAKLAVVRIQDAVSTHLVLQRKDFRFELDAIGASNLWPHVDLSRRLLVRVTVLENDFRIAHREAVHIGDSTAKDERIVVEPEVGGIAKNDLPDTARSQSRLRHLSMNPTPHCFAVRCTSLPKSRKACTETNRSGFRISLASR